MITKRLVYANLIALAINGALITLLIARTVPLLLGLLSIAACLGSAVWCSCQIQRPGTARRE